MRILPRPFGQVLNDGVVALGRVWRPLFATSLMVYLPTTLLTALIFSTTGVFDTLTAIVADPGYIDTIPEAEIRELLRPLLVAVGLSLLVQSVATLFLYLVAHRVIAADIKGDAMTGREARRHALKRMPPGLVVLIGAEVAVLGALVVGMTLWSYIGGTTFIGMFLFILALSPGTWLAVSFSMLSPVLALEKTGTARVLSRSTSLVKGRWGATLAFLLLVAMLGSAASSLIQWVTPLSLSGGVNPVVTVVGIIGVGFQGLIMAAIGVTWTHWYIDLRSRKEPMLIDQL